MSPRVSQTRNVAPARMLIESLAVEGLSLADVAPVPEGAERVLFKTPNSELWAQNEFPEEFARLNGEAAQLLVNRGVKLGRRLALGRRRGRASHPARGRRRPDRGP